MGKTITMNSDQKEKYLKMRGRTQPLEKSQNWEMYNKPSSKRARKYEALESQLKAKDHRPIPGQGKATTLDHLLGNIK